VFEGRDLAAPGTSTLADRVEEAFGLGTLAAEYRRFLARFGGVAEAFRQRAAGDAAQAFVVRSLLVHEYRRVRLRDPQLPLALLPADWPGETAYALCRDLYAALLPPSEAHLASVLAVDGERLLPALPEFLLRFAGMPGAPAGAGRAPARVRGPLPGRAHAVASVPPSPARRP